MKKLLVLSAAILFAFTMNAQKFGVKAGFNMSGYKVNFYVPDGAKMGTGFNFGLVGEMPITDKINLRANVAFNQLGSDYDSRDETDANWPARAFGLEYDQTVNVNYLQISITPKFNFGPAYAFVGPYFAYAINSSKTATYDFSGTTQSGTTDIFDDPNLNYDPTLDYSDTNNEGGSGDLHNRADFGLNLGFGANFSGIFVELSAGMGMLNFVNTDSDYYSVSDYGSEDDPTVPMTDDISQKNLFFGLSVGYMFGGK